jgi:hypothetical protein
MTRAAVLGLLSTVLMISLPHRTRAQDTSDVARLDPRTRIAVQRIIDSTRALGLPVTPLEWKIAEGLTKGADGPRILGAVQRSADGLRRARLALGSTSTVAELVAGANALQAGVSPEVLSRLRASQPARPVTTRLVVLSDLLSRGVPAADAAGVVSDLSAAGASDADFGTLRRDVIADLDRGTAPANAARSRARELGARIPVRERGVRSLRDSVRSPTSPPTGPPSSLPTSSPRSSPPAEVRSS